MNGEQRPTTEKEDRLNKIIEHVEGAEKYLRRASEITKKAGDKDGTIKIEKQVGEIEKLKSGFKHKKD